jgi:predicted RNA-binding protein YlxR (DUF448 family)
LLETKKRVFKRTCVACNGVLDRTSLLKITLASSTGGASQIVIDKDKKIPGRSFYLYPSRECLEKLIYNKRKSFKKLQSNLQFSQKRIDDLFTELKKALPDVPCLGCTGGLNAG